MTHKNTFKTLLLASSIVAASSVLTGCGDAEATANADEPEEIISIPVEVSDLTIGAISSNYETTAVLEAKEEAYVVARASGIIEHIYVEEGDYVEKGQPLAKLEQERYQLSLTRASVRRRRTGKLAADSARAPTSATTAWAVSSGRSASRAEAGAPITSRSATSKLTEKATSNASAE